MRTEPHRIWAGIFVLVTAAGCAGARRDEADEDLAPADTPAPVDALGCIAAHPAGATAADGQGGIVAAWGAAQDPLGPFVVRRIGADCAVVWEHRQEDGVLRYPQVLAVTEEGRVLVGGSAYRAEEPRIRERPRNEILFAALDATGGLLWEHQFHAVGMVNELRPAPGGDIVALGGFDSPVDLGGGVLQDSSVAVSTFLVRFDAAGRFLWDKNLGSRWDVRVQAVTVGADGSVAIGGRIRDFDFGNGALHASPPRSPGDERAPQGFTARYDVAGNLVGAALVPR
jgi:hypothetical protein